MSTAKTTRRLVQRERILLSLYRAAKGTTEKVPYEDLVIQAWKDYPEEFSLRNHPEFPEASDVHKQLYKDSYNIKEGLAVPLGNKCWRLTDKGVASAESLLAALDGKAPVAATAKKTEKPRLTRDAEAFIAHALKSRALSDWRTGQKEKLVDYDARVFFQFSTGTGMRDRVVKVKFAQESIAQAANFGVAEAAELKALSDFFMERFSALFKEA